MNRRAFLLAPLALKAAERKPNLLLMLARGWRAQATPWAGDADLRALHLARFGQQSLVFSRAYSCYPRAAPARVALETGKYPHGLAAARDGARLPPGEATLASVLGAAGYRAGTATPDSAAEFLERDRGVPFFLRLDLDLPRVFRQISPASIHLRANVPEEAAASARVSLARRYAQYAALDDGIGRALSVLDRLSLARATIAVFTSDCGEQDGSQGVDGDDLPFEESVRVPLAIRHPGVLAEGTRELLISQADLMPTLAGWCGQTPPAGVQGRDLSELLAGGKGDRPESVYAEGKIGQAGEWRMLALGSDKLVVNSQTEATHLYNLASDPYEMNNLAHEPSVRLKRDELLAALRASMRSLGDFKTRP